MKIIIDYDASWRHSFLDGSNNEPLPKKGRNFIGSISQLKKEGKYKLQEISLDTVLGVLNRLIGEQRKLYQIKQKLGNNPHYFEDIIHLINFEDKAEIVNQEIVYIRNMSGNTDQNSFTGMIKVDDPVFLSDVSQLFWGILWMDLNELCQFILENKNTDRIINLNPISILHRLEEIKSMKSVINSENQKLASEKLKSFFDQYKPLDKKEKLNVLSIYCSSLYLQLIRLESSHDISFLKSKTGGIKGISKNGFTGKDFMASYTTGPKKLIHGNPYMKEELIKKEGKIRRLLIKKSGQLHIYLNVNIDRAVEIKNMMDCACVSSFYLGKKGLAYVSGIDVR